MTRKSAADTIKYNNAYNAAAYDRVALMIPKGDKNRIKAHAAEHGESLNAFIRRAIDNQMEQDKKE